MSHNIEDFDGAKPDREGDVSITVSNLTDVDLSSVSTSHVLKYNGTQWVSEPATQYLLIGEGASYPYTSSHSGTAIGNANHRIKIYAENPINTIVGATVSYQTGVSVGDLVQNGKYVIASVGTTDFTTYGASANTVGTVFTANTSSPSSAGTGTVDTYWANSITLPAGTYIVQAQAVAKHDLSSAYLNYTVEIASNSYDITPNAETGPGNLYGASSTACGTVTFTSSTEINLNTISSNGMHPNSAQEDLCSKFNYLYVRKL